jgi:hypothetical protein
MAGRGRRAEATERWSDGRELRTSIRVLRALGLAPWTIEFYRQQGRKARRLPHEMVVAAAAAAARSTLRPPSSHRGRRPASLRARPERRAAPLAGVMRRQMFEASLALLADCGFDAWTLQCYRDAAPTIHVLPHDLVRFAVETIAWHRLSHDSRRGHDNNGTSMAGVLLLRNSIGGIGPMDEVGPRLARPKGRSAARRPAR